MLSFAGTPIGDLPVGHSVDVDIRTGSSALRVPVPVPPGRAGLSPGLVLQYASGSGNSAFGAGWGLSGLPLIGIDMHLGVPKWDGTDGYQLNGDPLVPWLEAHPDGFTARGFDNGGWSVAYLRSRRGTTSFRIERWLHRPTGRIHFRTRDASNLLTIFGARPNAVSRISDPDDEARTLAWLPEVIVDPHGNALWIEYMPENDDGVDRTASFERTAPAQRYLKHICYGNDRPLALQDAVIGGNLPDQIRWCFHVVLDYGDHTSEENPRIDPDRPLPARPDPFSSFRNGFEVRTRRLCRRFLSFHHFDELGPEPVPISALILHHDENPSGSTIREIVRMGWRHEAGTSVSASVPPLRMTYAPTAVDSGFVDAPHETQENLPAGIGSGQYAFVSLFGDGLPGILCESDRAWFYKPNLGGGSFGPQAIVAERPATRIGTFRFGDVDCDGNTDLSQMSGRLAGLYEFRRDEAGWSGFRPFGSIPHVEALGRRARWVDLNGDRRPDIVVTNPTSFTWFASDGDGFLPPVDIPRPAGLDAVPSLVTDLGTELFFADMTGSGLADLVRIRNGSVVYWPSLGNGRFGKAVVMEGSPRFSSDAEYDPSRLRLVDLDGSGTTDIIYLGRGEVRTWTNASGNLLLPGTIIPGLPYLDNLSTVSVLDFLGDGSICLVWSSPLPGRTSALGYLRLTPPIPPRLLVSVDNSMGRATHLTYSSSASHYLRDMRAGRGWMAKLPMHHPVVDRREVHDAISGSRIVHSFCYHDGHYDGDEREFRCFGQVDAYDMDATESMPGTAPSLTRSWFHLGTPMWSRLPPSEIYSGDPDLPTFAPHIVEDAAELTPDEIEDGLRALAGSVLRQETFATDANAIPRAHPFEVQQATYYLRRHQPAGIDFGASFSGGPLEEATWTYEQEPDDPRVSHRIVIESDPFDRPVSEATVGYARRPGRPRDVPAQDRTLISVQVQRLLDNDTPGAFELDIQVEDRRIELTGILPGTRGLFTREQFLTPEVRAALASPEPHHADLTDDPAIGPRARLLEWVRSYYWNAKRDAPLPLGISVTPSLIHHEKSACFTPEFIDAALVGRVDEARIESLGYRREDGVWWQQDATSIFDPANFSQRIALERGDGAVNRFEYDTYGLLVVSETDPVGNVERADIDYQQLAPWRITDPNGNVSEARYDALGVMVVSTKYGHLLDGGWGFDKLSDVAVQAQPDLGTLLADPALHLQGAAEYVWYDIHSWASEATPCSTVTLSQEGLPQDGTDGPQAAGRIQVSLSYLDGFGRPLQVKVPVEPGPAVQRDDGGNVIVDGGGRPVLAHADTRWLVSGHVAYDAKQQPLRQFEPFFSTTFAYEADEILRRFGTSTLTAYDALGRSIGQSLPDGTTTSATYHAWSVESTDQNDNVEGSAWALVRQNLPSEDAERQAYEQAKAHAGTGQMTFLDTLGRNAGALTRGGTEAPDRFSESRQDIEGNCLEIIDARGLTAFSYLYDMAGRIIRRNSIDAGENWSLADAFDREALSWNSRGLTVLNGFDLADRHLFTEVSGGDGPSPLDHRVLERVYGEGLPDSADAKRRNLLGRIAIVRDGAGETVIGHCDPSDNVMAARRRLRTDTDTEPDWRGVVPLEAEEFVTSAVFDGAGRTRSDTLPDGTVRKYEYLPIGTLSRVLVTTPGGALSDVPILNGASSNARGQRQSLKLGNSVGIDYGYDPDTFRLTSTTAKRGGTALQQIRYTYDPVGNITRIEDAAQDTVIAGLTVPARRDYSYDAHYRLRRATGRVHRALLPHDYIPGSDGTFAGSRRISLNDGGAVERFTQAYDYDAAGNMLRLRHVASSRNWTTDFWVSPTSNRSLPSLDQNGIAIADQETRFDAAGNLIRQAHLRSMAWDWSGALARAVTVERPGGTDDAERYVYGADGLRVRKVTTRVIDGGIVEETEKVYLGDQERKRIRRDGAIVLERWSTHVGDGEQRLAIVHRWTKDDSGREIDAAGQTRIHYQLNTHQGSSALELDADGKILSYEEYFPYGGTAFIAGDDLREVARKEYRYSGEERDDLTGFYAYGYRYYAWWMGRWLSPDPIGPEDDLNLYLFVLGNPVTNVDPDGHDTKPGEVVYVNRQPPVRVDNVEAQVRLYRVALSATYQAGFDTLSHAEQVKLVTAGGMWLVPTDPRAETGSTGWAVISTEEYSTNWLPARQEWAKQRKTHLKVELFSENPSRLGGTGSGGGDDNDTKEEKAATPPAGTAPSEAKAPGDGSSGDGAKGDADGKDKDGKDKDNGDGGGGGKKGTSDGGKTQGAGSGTGAGEKGQGSGGGNKGNGAGSGQGVQGVGQDVLDAYGNELGGMRGGRQGGILGGTANSLGHTPGGSGTLVDAPPSGGRSTSGRSGGIPSGAASDTGPSDRERESASGLGGNRDPRHGEAGSSPGSGAPHGTNRTQGQGPGGAGQDAQGEGPTGVKAILLEVAGWTNFEFGGKSEGGDPGGIPGGLGLLGLRGSFFQWLYIGTSFISFIEMILGIGALLKGLTGAIKGLFKLGRYLIKELPNLFRLGWRGISRVFASLAGKGRNLLARLFTRGGAKVIDPLVDTNILINAHKAWRGSTNAVHVAALNLLKDKAYQWVITPTVWKEFARIPSGGASARRFIKYLEKIGNTTVMKGAKAAEYHAMDAFKETMQALKAIANKNTVGLGTRQGTSTGKSFVNDIIQTAFARASGIPYVADKKFRNFITTFAPGWLKDIMKI